MADLRVENYDLEMKLREMLQNDKYENIFNTINSEIELERVIKLQKIEKKKSDFYQILHGSIGDWGANSNIHMDYT